MYIEDEDWPEGFKTKLSREEFKEIIKLDEETLFKEPSKFKSLLNKLLKKIKK